MAAEIKFGAMSIALLIFAAQALILAAALGFQSLNRRANRYLAALLVVMAGMLTPYIIGYAGFYDAYPWLSFAPFAVPLAVGPLLYGHVRAAVRATGLGWLHAVLPGAQFSYLAICFPLPLATKNWIDTEFQEPFLTPVLSVAVLLSMGGYALAGFKIVRRADPRGSKARAAALARLHYALVALLILVAARAGFDLYDALVRPLDYFDVFAFYVLLALVATLLGIEGWRAAGATLPSFEAAERDWAALARGWETQLRREGWWRDAELDLAELARRLGTNASYLSRGLNDGLGTNFADLLGGIRAEAVAARIDARASDGLLDLAFEAGFGSKASFNRAFGKRFGVTPSAYREVAKLGNLSSAVM